MIAKQIMAFFYSSRILITNDYQNYGKLKDLEQIEIPYQPRNVKNEREI